MQSKIAAIQNLISIHIEKSKLNADGELLSGVSSSNMQHSHVSIAQRFYLCFLFFSEYQRQERQKLNLLKIKVEQLNHDEHNRKLSKYKT